MRPNLSNTLKIFFDIKQDVIDRDLRRAKEDIRTFQNELSSILALPLTERTPETEARLAHLWMVRAYEFCHRDAIAPEFKAFHTVLCAGIVRDAETVASDKDTCAELSSRMALIRRREGLADDEFWEIQDEEPPDYRELEDKFLQVTERVYDTVFAFVLRRYHMDEQADLFERDRREFEIQREIGSRVNSPPRKEAEDIEKGRDEYFLGEYGADALQRVHSRVKELRELIDNGMTEFQE